MSKKTPDELLKEAREIKKAARAAREKERKEQLEAKRKEERKLQAAAFAGAIHGVPQPINPELNRLVDFLANDEVAMKYCNAVLNQLDVSRKQTEYVNKQHSDLKKTFDAYAAGVRDAAGVRTPEKPFRPAVREHVPVASMCQICDAACKCCYGH